MWRKLQETKTNQMNLLKNII